MAPDKPQKMAISTEQRNDDSSLKVGLQPPQTPAKNKPVNKATQKTKNELKANGRKKMGETNLRKWRENLWKKWPVQTSFFQKCVQIYFLPKKVPLPKKCEQTYF